MLKGFVHEGLRDFFEENHFKSLEKNCQGCANMQGQVEPCRRDNDDEYQNHKG